VSTNLSVVPCTEDFESQAPKSVLLQFSITNEFEQTFSASTTITCWASLQLDAINPIFDVDAIGGQLLLTKMRTTTTSGSPFRGGVVAVLEETHEMCPDPSQCSNASTLVTRAASNAHSSLGQDFPDSDIITIPNEQISGE